MTELNYKQEMKTLNEKTEWFTPKEGKHQIRILKVGDEYTTTFEGKESLKRLFVIQCVNRALGLENPPLNWGIVIGKTQASLYGQLMKVGELRGKLENETIHLLVKGAGKDKKYIIEEALEEEAPTGASLSSLVNDVEKNVNKVFSEIQGEI